MNETNRSRIIEYIKYAVDEGSSDLHIAVGSEPMIRKSGQLVKIPNSDRVMPEDAIKMALEITPKNKRNLLKTNEEIDYSFSIKGVGRFRVNVYKQRGTIALALRSLPFEVPNVEKLGLPEVVKGLAKKTKGLILVTGVTGSGKSTTLASLIDLINSSRNTHIITIEDPIEFLHRHKESFVTQREIGQDSKNFTAALRAALREDPDVILVGEMRDLETIQIALTAAETGHLVLSTMHTLGAAKTIDRIIDAFPASQQNQVQAQIATSLISVISQQLIPDIQKKKRYLATEIMISNPAIKNMIREGKPHQINSVIQSGKNLGMHSMEKCIADLYLSGKISKDSAESRVMDLNLFKQYLSRGGI